MKNLVVLILLVMVYSQMFGQVKIETEFSVYIAHLQLKANQQKKIKGALFSLTDSTIVLANTTHKKDLRSGNYFKTTYRFEDIRAINGRKVNENAEQNFFLLQKLGKKAIIKTSFENLKSSKVHTEMNTRGVFVSLMTFVATFTGIELLERAWDNAWD